MTLDEFFAQLEPMKGEFFTWHGEIRHSKKQTKWGGCCCPILSLHPRHTELENINYLSVGSEIGLSSRTAINIAYAADGHEGCDKNIRKRLLALCEE